jgi:putative flippase GtrA
MRYLELPATHSVRRSRRGMKAFLWSKAARPLRFAGTGGAAALVQLAILDVLIDARWPPIPANLVALLLSTQVNFVLSYLFTWHDRRPAVGTPLVVLGRWAAYQGSVTGTAVLNMAIFIIARADLHALLASALGTAVAAVINFVAGDRLVFRRRASST